MFKFFAIVFFLLLFLPGVNAQSPTAWINPDQVYYRIPVARDALYRLSFSQLQQSGFPVESIDPRNIQIFHRGAEQAIMVQGQQDGQFDSGDFIDFFGRKNDGTRDAALFDNSSLPANPYHNLFSDTTVYFLTVGSLPGKRMTVVNETNAGIPVAEFHLDEKLTVFADDYAVGVHVNNELFSSTYDAGEGWTSTRIFEGQNRDVIISNISGMVQSAPSPQLQLLLVGRNSTPHTVEVLVGPSMRLLKSLTIDPYVPFKLEEPIEWTDISNDGKLTVRLRVPSQGYGDHISVSYVRLLYAQVPNAENATEKFLTLSQNPDNKVNLVIQNAPASSRLFDITEPSSVRYIESSGAPNLTSVVTETSTSRRLLVTSAPLTPAKLVRMKFRSVTPGQPNYIIISHPRLRKPGGGYSDPVKAYASYRASTEGGQYDTLILHSREAFDLYNYGEQSPLAIFKMLEELSSPARPSYLFLIGKGLEIWHRYYRTPGAGSWDFQDLVPTGGFPGSDIIYSLGSSNFNFASGVPTGRLPAMSPGEVAAYLNKVIETEALPYNSLWRKKLLHLSGGIESWEPAAFKRYLEDFQAIAEGPYLGGVVSAIAKQSREIQVINIAEEVNNGLGLITFFGHSSTSTLDFDVGYVTNPVLGYNNAGKYPMLLMNGCEVGAFFLRGKLFGEDWMLADKKGSIGFIAHNAYALVPNLYRYTKSFYQVAFADSVFIKKGIGDIQLETARRYMEDLPSTITNMSQFQQMILLADPAVKLFGASKPDLEIKEEQVSVQTFNNQPLTVSLDSFAIKLIVSNLGMAKPGLYNVEVERTFSDNTSVVYDSIFDVPMNADTILFVIRRGAEKGFGNNTFRITLDPENIISELNENNNEASYTLFMPLNGTKNLYPSPFGIVTQEEVPLSFQATDLYSPSRDFLLEIDTVHTFDSEYKKEVRVKAKVLANHRLQMLPADTLAYYWRTRLADPLPGESAEWMTSSFTYINEGKEGWAQVHFPQYLTNASLGLEKLEDARRIEFKKSVTPVSITTFGADAVKPFDSISVLIDGAEFNLNTQGWGCRTNTINLIAFDRRSTTPYAGVYMKWYEMLYVYGRQLCGREPFVMNSFTHTEVARGVYDLIQYVNNVADGDSVVLFTRGHANIHLWPDAAKEKVSELGISLEQLNDIIPGEPIIIFARKGADPGTARIFKSSDSSLKTARLKVNQTITGGFSSGTMSSGLIGPAQTWDELSWKSSEIESQDVVRFDVIGVSLKGDESVVLQDVAGNEDLSMIDAHQYPYIKIVFYTEDNTLLTASQLNNWIVHFTPVPEGVLLPDNPSDQISLEEGQQVVRDFRFVNISSMSFNDSLHVSFRLYNNTKSESRSKSSRIKAPLPADTTFFSVSNSTRDFEGVNDIEVFVNPRIHPEQYYDNNIIQLKNHVLVKRDQIAPVLDVTFDGHHIYNGESVTSNPLIRVNLWDENDHLKKIDTAGMRIFLTYPCEISDCVPVPISLKGELVKWYPASQTDNFRIDFQPVLANGIYTLRVEGADARGNAAEQPYEISFEVNDRTGVSFLTPHPNPLVSDIFYGFLLTGNENPSLFIFDVHDLTGKLIYSNDKSDAFHTGKNLYHWDGRDKQNNRLPSGIYVFTIRLSVAGKEYRKQGKLLIQR